MRKLLLLLIFSFLIFAFCGCNLNGLINLDDLDLPLHRVDSPNAVANANGGKSLNPVTVDIESILSGNGGTDVLWGLQNESIRNELVSAAQENGYDVTFGEDGSVTFIGESGAQIVQNPDGTWNIDNGSGTIPALNQNWPDNEFTKLIPKLPFDIITTSSDSDTFAAFFTADTLNKVKEYVEVIKNSGFEVDSDVQEQEIMGIVMYSYTASNSSGYSITVGYNNGTGTLSIDKPN